MPTIRLVNPSRSRRRHSSGTKRHRRRHRNTTAAQRAARAAFVRKFAGGGHMAKKRHHRRRSNPHRNARRRHRSNPRRSHHTKRHHLMLFAPRRHHRRRNPGLRSTFGNLLPLGAGVVGGYFVSRIVPASIPQLQPYNTGMTGFALNGATGFLAYMIVKRWNRSAGTGILLGTGLAIAVRLYETYAMPAIPAPAPAAAMSGDMGYYVSDRYPYPQGNGGPYDAYPGQPYLSTPPFPATSAAAVRAGAAAAAAALPPAVASPGVSGGGSPLQVEAERWGSIWR